MNDSRYRITERIGAGPMTEVWSGVAESIQGFRRNVAIKRLLPGLQRRNEATALFLDEARLALHLQHANVVHAFDIGRTDDGYFLVLERVEGVDLQRIAEWRRRIGRPLTVGQTIYIVMELCKGLHYAHQLAHPETGLPLGILHRDVAPRNVLLSHKGEVKLSDFRPDHLGQRAQVAGVGVIRNHQAYLSPEAAHGLPVDERADIFVVGILLYEMLTDRALFVFESEGKLLAQLGAGRVPAIAPQNPEVEPDLEAIVHQALAPRPEDRFASAGDLQDALAHYLFSRGLKMVQRDMVDLVRSYLEEEAPQLQAKPRSSIIESV